MKKLIVGTAAIGLLLGALAISAFAAGNGYGPVNVGTSTSVNTGAAFQTVLTARTFDSKGGQITTSFGGSSFTLVITKNAFDGKQVTLTSGDASALSSLVPSGNKVITTIGVNFDGVPGQPIQLTVKNTAIPANAAVFKIQKDHLIPISATVTAGQAIISFQNDPDFVIVSPIGVVPKGTSPKTGAPLVGLAEGAGLLLLGGAFVVVSRLNKKTTL